MKNTTLFGFILIILLLVGYFLFFNTTDVSGVTGNVVGSNGDSEIVNNEDTQKITLGTRNYNYYPNEFSVKANQLVEITLDDSVRGCLRSFSIRDLGISKFSQNPSQKIVFTPTQIGSFKFSCSMGMGYGTINIR